MLHDPLQRETSRPGETREYSRGECGLALVEPGDQFCTRLKNSVGHAGIVLVSPRVSTMNVKYHSNISVPGKQNLQLSPGDTTLSTVESIALDEQREQKHHFDEGMEQQQLAEELLASEQRFRITFEQAPIGMAHVGIDGRWLLVNQQLCNLLGYTQEELLKRTFHAVMLPEDLSTAFEYAQSILTGESQTYQHELRFVCKDGTQFWVNLTVTLVRDSTGMPLYFLAVAEDLTDRKQAAQQRRLNQLKDQFIVNVNHELRTPLTQLFGYLELLTEYQGQLDTETQAQFIIQAKEGCQELILLINHVLDALAVTEALQPPPCELIELAPLVRDVLEHLDPQKVEADRVFLTLPVHLMVWANGQLLRQVLRNLLSNAFKYCPKPATVIIRTTQIDAKAQGPGSAQEVCLCVQDAGPGIPPEELPLLFQKFVRLQRDLSGTIQGSGLGLYISKQFVEAMQGRIWVESAGIAGQGSSFFVTLPSHPQAQSG